MTQAIDTFLVEKISLPLIVNEINENENLQNISFIRFEVLFTAQVM